MNTSTDSPTLAGTTLAARYSKEVSNRQPYLNRARINSTMTNPLLMPPEGHNAGTVYFTAYQGAGNRAIDALQAKISDVLMPPNEPALKLVVNELTMMKLAKQPGQKKLWNQALAKCERSITQYLEGTPLRAKLGEVSRQLLVAGNVLLKYDFEKTRIFKLSSYVVRRDGSGSILWGVTEERVSPETLEPEVLATLGISPEKMEEDLVMYTGVIRSGKMFKIHQEINGVTVPGSEGSYPLDKCPWLFLRLYPDDGQSYGRSFVDGYIADLQSLDGLTKSSVQLSAASSKVVFGVGPGAGITAAELAKAKNGSFKDFNADAVKPLQINKANDLAIVKDLMAVIQHRIQLGFLDDMAIQRDGERVTAEEIRVMARALERVMGDIYTLLSMELQKPLYVCVMAEMTEKKILPPLPKENVVVTIVTGLAALGRGQDADRISMALNDLAIVGKVSPDILKVMNLDELVSRIFVARGVDVEDLVKTDQEQQEEAQEEQQQEMQQQAAAAAASHAGTMAAQNQMSQQPQPGPQGQ